MARILIDTDIFIDHLRGYRRLAVAQDTVFYSVITRCELFAGARTDENVVRVLLAPFAEIVVDAAVAERAGQIRRASRVRIADALIAATALENDLQLLTRNLRDFQGVPGLRVASPPAS